MLSKKIQEQSLELPLNVLKSIYLSRFLDEKTAKLVRQNKGGTFHLSAAGHEMVGAMAGHVLQAGVDWFYPYYRDQALAIALGCDLKELCAVFLGRETENHSSGRMMPYHYCQKSLRIPCQSSVVGTQFLHACGRALAVKNLGKNEIVYVSGGDGSSSEGDFFEALNFSALHQLPVLFVIQDNGWAISVQSHEQTAGSSIGSNVRGFSGLKVIEVNGVDYDSTHLAFEKSVEHIHKGKGPVLIHAKVVRLSSHSNSDDQRRYKSEESLIEESGKDPLKLLENWLLERGASLDSMREEARMRVEEATAAAELVPFPQKGSTRHFVFTPYEPPVSLVQPVPEEAEKVVMVDQINHALDEEMAIDPYLVVLGEDVAHGKGGVFGATRHLTEKHGAKRCFNTPLAESTIIGVAIGLASDGLHRAVAEIQFADYLWTGIDQLVSEAASISYRSNGQYDMPIVIRLPYGGYIQGGPYHSQSIEGFLAHCPGLKIVIPSNASDAKGLLKTAIRDPNPVLFFEHKALYRDPKFAARPEMGKDFLLPFGQANIVRSGADITVVAWGLMVSFAVEVADKLKKEGINLEVIDLRTLVPLDIATIDQSVKKTGKLMIVHEAPKSAGFGAEIAARISEELFEALDAPILRVGGFGCAIPYSKPLEEEVLPQVGDIEEAARRLLRY